MRITAPPVASVVAFGWLLLRRHGDRSVGGTFEEKGNRVERGRVQIRWRGLPRATNHHVRQRRRGRSCSSDAARDRSASTRRASIASAGARHSHLSVSSVPCWATSACCTVCSVGTHLASCAPACGSSHVGIRPAEPHDEIDVGCNVARDQGTARRPGRRRCPLAAPRGAAERTCVKRVFRSYIKASSGRDCLGPRSRRNDLASASTCGSTAPGTPATCRPGVPPRSRMERWAAAHGMFLARDKPDQHVEALERCGKHQDLAGVYADGHAGGARRTRLRESRRAQAQKDDDGAEKCGAHADSRLYHGV